MDLSQIIPSCFEFVHQVNNFNFDQGELDTQNEIILKANFKSWDSYLQNRHHLFSNIINVENFVTEIASLKNGTVTFSGDLNLISNKHFNDSIMDECMQGHEQLSKLSIKKTKEFKNFEIKLLNLFTRLLINNNKELSDIINAFSKDFENQNNLNNPQGGSGTFSPLAYSEAISLPNINKYIRTQDSKNFYFPNKAIYLKDLHDALVEHELIEANSDFEKLFENEFALKNHLKPIVWNSKKSITKLFYLLYKLADEENVHRGYSISKIAFDLFKLNAKTSENSLNVNLNEVIFRFDDRLYIQRNMKPITEILNSLNL